MTNAEQRWLAWQSVDSGRLLLLAISSILVVVALVRTAVGFADPHHVTVAFGLFIAFGELLRLALPGSRETAPIAMSAALAYALTLSIAVPSQVVPAPAIPPLKVIAVAAAGMALGALPHIAAGRPAGLTGMSARLVVVALVAFAFRPMANHGMFAHRLWFAITVMAVLAVLAWLLETVIAAVIRAEDLRARYSVTFWDEVKVQWRLGLAVGVCAIITVLGAQVMGISELAVFAGPLLVIQLAFRRYAGIRATYLQTVRALSQVTEVGGYVESGHSSRVGKLALAVGRELGMSEPELLTLEYAALMHDIGQLSLRDPIPGGATVLVSPADQDRIAEFGADVISRAGVLDEVAELVRCQAWPARGHSPVPPLGSRIIKAANAFDDVVGSSTDRDRSADAIDRMRLDPVGYDVQVVEALRDVAGRRVPSRL